MNLVPEPLVFHISRTASLAPLNGGALCLRLTSPSDGRILNRLSPIVLLPLALAMYPVLYAIRPIRNPVPCGVGVIIVAIADGGP